MPLRLGPWPGKFRFRPGLARARALSCFRQVRDGDLDDMVPRDDLQTIRTDDVFKEKQAKEMEEREMFCSNGHRHEQLRFWFHLLANR